MGESRQIIGRQTKKEKKKIWKKESGYSDSNDRLIGRERGSMKIEGR